MNFVTIFCSYIYYADLYRIESFYILKGSALSQNLPDI